MPTYIINKKVIQVMMTQEEKLAYLAFRKDLLKEEVKPLMEVVRIGNQDVLVMNIKNKLVAKEMNIHNNTIRRNMVNL